MQTALHACKLGRGTFGRQLEHPPFACDRSTRCARATSAGYSPRVTTCAYCDEDDGKRRFIVQGARANARICDACLCMYAAHVAHERGLPPPPAIAKLGVRRTYAEVPVERSLRRLSFVFGRARAAVGARIRGVFGRRASSLARYFVRPPVSPLEAFERRCAFCGARDVQLYGGKARICAACVQHAATTLLG